MATLVLRTVKGSPLTNLEVDGNFSNIDSEVGVVFNTANTINSNVGVISNLVTTAKSNIVSAVNEIRGGNLSQFTSTTSADLAGLISDETGSGLLVFATSPTLVSPVLGTPSSGNLINATSLPIVNGTTGTLTVARGGTGVTGPGTVGNVLVSDGTGFISSAPAPGFTTGKAIAMALVFGG